MVGSGGRERPGVPGAWGLKSAWPMDRSHEITRLLIAHQEGDREAFDRLMPLVYEDLRRIARSRLAGHRRGYLDTTMLVHEAYLDLVDQTRVPWSNRAQFFAIAARAMRQIVVDFARRRRAGKRGGGSEHIPLDATEIAVDDTSEELLLLDDGLRKLEAIDERMARVVECRFFGGMTEQETAEALDSSLRTVQRDWKKARAWLKREMAPR